VNKLLVVILAVSLLVSLPLAGCRGLAKGSGELQTEDRDFIDFSCIEASGPLEVNNCPLILPFLSLPSAFLIDQTIQVYF